MKSKLWRIKGDGNNRFNDIKGLSPLVSLVLNARCQNEKEAQELLSADSTIFSPFLFPHMEKAVLRIRAAMENEEQIAVYGDYDCDGAAATAILYDYLQNVGAKVIYYIPHREKEGYGMNCGAVDLLKGLGVSLIITVDNGISAIEEIAYANTLGIDTIVTDHHTPKPELPPAFCTINPHIKDCGYPFPDLSGAGVAFKLVCALEDDLGYELIEQYGDLLAISTIGDIVSLLNENRYFVKKGLNLLQTGSRVGIKALFEVAGVDLSVPLTAETIAFTLCPRINAAGRMETADYAVMLMLTEDEDEAAELAAKLNEFNEIRKNEEKNIVDDIGDMLSESPELLDLKIPVLYKEGWNGGIVGIVASRLSERLQRPTLILGGDGENAKGSGRSVEGFSLIDAIAACSAPLKFFGGHPMAAGLSLKTANISEFSKLLQEYEKEHPVPPVYLTIDAEISPEILTPSNIEALEILSPFQTTNPPPVFAMREVTVKKVDALSNGRHIKVRIEKNGKEFPLLCFGIPYMQRDFFDGDLMDIAFTPSINTWGGKNEVSLNCVSIKESGVNYEDIEEDISLYRNFKLYDELNVENLPQRDESALVYKFIKIERLSEKTLISQYIGFFRKCGLPYIKFLLSLDILRDLGTVRLNERGYFEIISNAPKVNFLDSPIVRRLTEKNG